jgi:glycosyltransferase 2 family protein
MSRTLWAWARLLGGAAVLAVLIWRLGTGPFLDGIATISVSSLVAAAGIAVVTTVCCAWRWSIVARGLGVHVPLRTAIAAYYRSQFLNTTLPGGVLGDVHRGVRHGRDVGDLGRGLRAVAWERSAGQVVQLVLALVLLLILASPVRSSMPIVAGVVVVSALVVVLLARTLSHDGPSRWARLLRTVNTDVRDGVLARRSWPGITVASAVAVIGHTATFLIAARTAGSSASVLQMLPLAMVVLLAMGVPTNIAGWGPREGVAAWAFGAAGLGADLGLSTAVVYGVLVLVANLPGAGVLVIAWIHRHLSRRARAGGRAQPSWSEPDRSPAPVPVPATPAANLAYPQPRVDLERTDPARWRTPATAEPKGATRG